MVYVILAAVNNEKINGPVIHLTITTKDHDLFEFSIDPLHLF